MKEIFLKHWYESWEFVLAVFGFLLPIVIAVLVPTAIIVGWAAFFSLFDEDF